MVTRLPISTYAEPSLSAGEALRIDPICATAIATSLQLSAARGVGHDVRVSRRRQLKEPQQTGQDSGQRAEGIVAGGDVGLGTIPQAT